MQRAAARRVIEHFVAAGHSEHSPGCSTAWPILEYARVKGLKHDVQANDYGWVRILALRDRDAA